MQFNEAFFLAIWGVIATADLSAQIVQDDSLRRAPRTTLGVQGFYYFHPHLPSDRWTDFYREGVGVVSLTHRMGARVHLGAEYFHYWITPSYTNSTYSLYTALLKGQLDLIARGKGNFYARFGIGKGNVCACEREEFYREPNLTYVNWGLGLSYAFNRYIHLKVEYADNLILKYLNKPYGHNSFYLGINLLLPKISVGKFRSTLPDFVD